MLYIYIVYTYYARKGFLFSFTLSFTAAVQSLLGFVCVVWWMILMVAKGLQKLVLELFLSMRASVYVWLRVYLCMWMCMGESDEHVCVYVYVVGLLI